MKHAARSTARSTPALQAAACFAVGIALATAWPGLSPTVWAAGALLSLAATAAATRHARRRLVTAAPLLATLAAAALLVAAGAVRTAFRQTPPPRHAAHFVDTLVVPARFEGIVRSPPRLTTFDLRFRLELTGLVVGNDLIRVEGVVEVARRMEGGPPGLETPEGDPVPGLLPGTRIRLTGRLEPLPTRRNPAAFDYGAYLRRQGIAARLSVEPGAGVSVEGQTGGVLARLGVRARAGVHAALARTVPGEAARALIEALLTGDRTGLDDAVTDRFARTGLMHLLAVSGLHVMLVGLVLHGFLKPVLLRCGLRWRAMERTRAAATLAVLCGYLLLTGPRPSVVRAVVMTALLIGGDLLQRPAPALNTLGVAGLVQLAARPEALFDLGFQLSFTAVGALLTLLPVLDHALRVSARPRALRWALQSVTASLAATLGTLPVLLVHLGTVPLGGLLLNVIGVPLTAGALGAGVLAVLTSAGPGPAVWFGSIAGTLADLLMETARLGDHLLGGVALTGYVDRPATVLALFTVLATLAAWTRRRARWRLLAAVLLVLGLDTWGRVLTGAYSPRLDLVVLDVGQGDAVLVRLPGGGHVLVDAGPRTQWVDEGARTVLPHLDRYGVRSLEALVVSHPHSDHLGGVPAVLRAVPVRRVIVNGMAYESDLYAAFRQVTDSLGVPLQRVDAGDTLDVDPDVRLQVLSPTGRLRALGAANEASVVLRMAYGRTAFLLLGDAEDQAERSLAAYGALLRSDVVKVGHHGSRTSSHPGLVEAVSDAGSPWAVVSVARRNRYGLPSEEVLDRWRAHGARLRSTADAGAVWLRSDGRRVREVDWRRDP